MTNSIISVVIPVLNHSKYTSSILNDILNNSEVPNEIIIIDNGSTDNTEKVISQFKNSLPIKYLKLKRNRGVNTAWNIGLTYAKSEIIAVLNNDLVLNRYFFEVMRKTFNRYPECGMLYSKTLHKAFDEEDISKYLEKVKNSEFSGVSPVSPAKYRMGWAFGVRKSLVKDIIIPKELFNYCGDDFQYLTIKKLGYSILIMNQNLIFHHEGVTGKNTKLRDRMFEDTRVWDRIRPELEL